MTPIIVYAGYEIEIANAEAKGQFFCVGGETFDHLDEAQDYIERNLPRRVEWLDGFGATQRGDVMSMFQGTAPAFGLWAVVRPHQWHGDGNPYLLIAPGDYKFL